MDGKEVMCEKPSDDIISYDKYNQRLHPSYLDVNNGDHGNKHSKNDPA